MKQENDYPNVAKTPDFFSEGTDTRGIKYMITF